MAISLNRNLADVEAPDGLISGLTPPPQVRGAEIAAIAEEGVMKRGTILAVQSDGTLVVLGTSVEGEQKFSGDASATTFTISAKPKTVTAVKVGDTAATIVDYNPLTGVVTLSAAPAAGTNNVVATYPTDELIPFGILCDDTAVGTSDSVKAAVYTAGCFDPQKCIVADDYELTAADLDALRIRDIVFRAAQPII